MTVAPAPHVIDRAFTGLTARQAKLTLLIVVALGVLTMCVQSFIDWRSTRESVARITNEKLDMTRDSAAEAAFQLSSNLADQVVEGLAHDDTIVSVALTDNFGKMLSERGRPDQPAWADWLFSDMARFQRQLTYDKVSGSASVVGQITIALSPAKLARDFLAKTLVNVALWFVQALVICLLVVGVFYAMVTRPLLLVARAIGQVDPNQPGRQPIPPQRGHEQDELGGVVTTLNRLLGAFQQGLDERDKAEGELRDLTRTLEDRVVDRTRALEHALEELSREKEEAEHAFRRLDEAHGALNRANTQILESIHYARRIQTALLPDKQALGSGVSDIEVIWEPVHLVGGDYFWLERLGDRSLIFIADCTGHGVPGAFMTLVAASALDQILRESVDRSPSQILGALDAMVRTRLRQNHPDSESDDGLDAAICIYDPKENTVTFAGANIPLLYGSGGMLQEIRGDRMSLGYRTGQPGRTFTDHVVPVTRGDVFYLFTDGIPDHIGGEPRLLLGRKRLTKMLSSLDESTLAARLVALQKTLDAYRGDQRRRDDMTMIGFVPK